MRDVTYFVACSLDGFIATIDDRFDWLFTDDDLPGRPIDALRENRGSEVKRRAQVLEY